MPRTLPSPAATDSYSELINRRVSIRYTGGLATIATTARKTTSAFRKARILDVSQGGIALELRRAPKVGEFILLQLTNRILQFSFDMAAEVRHVRRAKPGRWVVGLAFDDALTLAELAALL